MLDHSDDAAPCNASAIGIVSTSLHLIYLAEFAHQQKLGSLEIVVLLKRPTDRPQIEQVLHEVEHTHVHWVILTKDIENRFISIFEVFAFKGVRLQRESYDFGVYADYGRSMLANLNCQEYYWLGDGTKLIYETSASGRASLSRFKLHKFFDPITRALIGKRIYLPKEPHIFSPFKLDVAGQEVNSFKWLRSKYDFEPSAVDRSSVYFFGSYFSERTGEPLMLDSHYLDYMRAIASLYQAKNIDLVYVPHRHESSGKLDLINQIPGCRVERFQYPAEMAFYKRREYPVHIASFFSTCLFHFEMMDICDSVTSFYIDFSRHNLSYAPVAAEIYQALETVLGQERVVRLNVDQETLV